MLMNYDMVLTATRQMMTMHTRKSGWQDLRLIGRTSHQAIPLDEKQPLFLDFCTMGTE